LKIPFNNALSNTLPDALEDPEELDRPSETTAAVIAPLLERATLNFIFPEATKLDSVLLSPAVAGSSIVPIVEKPAVALVVLRRKKHPISTPEGIPSTVKAPLAEQSTLPVAAVGGSL